MGVRRGMSCSVICCAELLVFCVVVTLSLEEESGSPHVQGTQCECGLYLAYSRRRRS